MGSFADNVTPDERDDKIGDLKAGQPLRLVAESQAGDALMAVAEDLYTYDVVSFSKASDHRAHDCGVPIGFRTLRTGLGNVRQA